MIERYFFYFIKIIKSLLTRPIQTLKWIRVDYKKDLSCKNFKSKYHFVWCAGLPKSGTTLVEQIFDNLPYVRQYNSFNRVYYTGKLDHDHGISNEMFKNYSKTKYTFLKTHTHYDKKYEDIAINNNLKIIISLRDLRDMLISRYFHILADKKHWLHQKLKNLAFTEGFLVSLQEKENPKEPDALRYYYYWILNWLKVAKERNYLILWFEDYKENPINYIKSILKYVDFREFSSNEIEKKISKYRNKTLSLSENLKTHGRIRSTLRKGEVGEWKNLFNEEITKYFYSNIPDKIEKIEYKNNK